MNRLFHRTRDEVQPHCSLVLLANTIDSSNGLEFESGVEKRLAEENMVRIDEVEAARVSASM